MGKVTLNRSTGEITYNNGEYKIQMNDEGGILYLSGKQVTDITHSTAPKGKWRWFGLSTEQVLCSCSEIPNFTGMQTIMFALLAGIYEMYIRCQDNEHLENVLSYILSGIKEREYGIVFTSKVKVDKLYKKNPGQMLLLAKMKVLWLLNAHSVSEATALRLFPDIKTLKIV